MKKVTRAIIINEKGKVLLGKRARGIASGLYALIGGKPDEGEVVRDAVIREVKEEIGLDFEPTLYMERIDSSSDPNDPWLVYYFIGIANGTLELEPDEVESIIYISEDELDEIEIAFDHKERLVEYFQSSRG